jgi:hypothetical protein
MPREFYEPITGPLVDPGPPADPTLPTAWLYRFMLEVFRLLRLAGSPGELALLM